MKSLQITPLESKTIPYQVLAEFTGEDLAGTTYEQLIPWFLHQMKILKRHSV